jgi:KUP system potassium uptake protein
VFLSVRNEDVPYVNEDERITVEDLGHDFYRVIARYGFMENADVPEIMGRVVEQGLKVDLGMPTYVLSRNVVLPAKHPPLARWREWLFIVLMRNALRPTQFFKIPPNQVVEIGRQISL